MKLKEIQGHFALAFGLKISKKDFSGSRRKFWPLKKD
jgi:hypothetical protein